MHNRVLRNGGEVKVILCGTKRAVEELSLYCYHLLFSLSPLDVFPKGREGGGGGETERERERERERKEEKWN